MYRKYRIVQTKDMDPTRLREGRKIINHVLNHSKGWKKYGVIFEDVTDTDDKSKEVIKVKFVSNNTMKRNYASLNNLSAYDITANEVHFNINNWDNGGVDPFNNDGTDSLMRYRTYVINHEFGHSLGLDHAKPNGRDGKRGSVMMQMTKGKQHIHPCTLNEWPLEKEDFHELNDGSHFKTIFDSKIMGGAAHVRSFASCNWVLILIILLIMIVILICIKCNRSKYINQRYVRPLHDNRYFS
jgi:hypothetical protein